MQTHKLTMQTHKLKSAFRHLALVCALMLAVNASAEVASLTYRTFSLNNGELTAEVVSPVGGTLVLVSGTRDRQADYAKWDQCISLGAISADEPKAVAATIPAGHTYARLCVATCQYPVYDYLEGDGQAYLELDYTLSSADQVAISLAATEKTAYGAGIFGSRGGASVSNFTLLNQGSSAKFALDFNSSAYATYRAELAFSVETRYDIVISKTGRLAALHGSTPSGTGAAVVECPDDFTTPGPCRLFDAVVKPGSYQPAFKGRIYSFTISTLATGEVQRDLVAINMGTDDAPRPAMYDVKTGKTYEDVSKTDGAAFTLGAKTGATVGEVAGVVALGLCVVTDVTPEVQIGHCLTLPVGSDVGGVNNSSATFSALGVTKAYTYACRFRNPSPQTWDNATSRYYGHIMGAGASNSNRHNGYGAPLLFCDGRQSRTGEGDRWIEIQTWNSGGYTQCLTVLGYSSSNKSWEPSKVSEITALEDGGWHALVVTYDAENQHAMVFVDGLLKHDITSANLAEYLNYCDKNAGTDFATPGNNGQFGVGRNQYATDSFAGSLSEVSVWNRALTEAEAINVSTNTLAGNEEGLVLYWPLNAETGTTAADQQTNGQAHDGTVYSSGSTECSTYWDVMVLPQIIESYARDRALVVTVAGATNLYLAYGARRGGDNPMSWEHFTFVTVLPSSLTGLGYSLPVPAGAVYMQALLGTGPTAGDLSSVKIISAGLPVAMQQGCTIFIK